ncbi:phytoene synthase [candidate division WOR-1 bacterium RIFOXYA12_FULL_52_29]|uniref:Phytoene synthase n=1 Tax=candidate division WOR-1 bacterium RIFOXYC12_FULL_54_18 TaxID=1802584 RepID=A0A1F4T7N3_UNCSA|nr:MAG: phytoene synthase [candidate division WOR-1 bacterium RIFOXYA2_FULL_51_19]OGC18311.1 MAG: phytoene synthase [candidate division WOR-1 bacterium RIFOXYA12_FULL_52_29]OGC27166.1 MAG: phytoene synthase [candidate division WOR-1 bacterium RIFOXYB2_FULL_45_9]OGC28728.1 MAG: phytoene synthase [candidate division WOR-1 bacterium RIFOXYC12_FULL_54_18]OGC30817.1 MAG: phytoene synthase [candidate division WOR-1 bacterium RIFOXYB12_FULL_52_16]
MPDKLKTVIFKKGSRTYFYSSLFFPREVKEDVFTLYAFVRRADDFVDAIPQDKSGFLIFRENYRIARRGLPSGDPVIDWFVKLADKRGFRPEWIDAFLSAMEQDLDKKIYATLEETENYMYGSAEVVGLMMAAILGLPEKSYPMAKALGKAMQYINFIRDIREDQLLGRRYLPTSELEKFGLDSLEERAARRLPERFAAFIGGQLAYYRQWQAEADPGYRYLSWRCFVPIKTAADMYAWTARQIDLDPLIVFKETVKPPRRLIIGRALLNACPLIARRSK